MKNITQQHTCFSALVGCVVKILFVTNVETLSVFDATISAISVTILVNVAVTSDINGVAIVAGRV